MGDHLQRRLQQIKDEVDDDEGDREVQHAQRVLAGVGQIEAAAGAEQRHGADQLDQEGQRDQRQHDDGGECGDDSSLMGALCISLASSGDEWRPPQSCP
ncbi:hypothetical protein D3C80_1588640 [compost metagenome]